MIIIDSQVHTARPGRGLWPPTLAERGARLRRGEHCFPDIDQLVAEMDAASVSAAVLVPPLAVGERPDVRPWLADAARFPGRFCVMARFGVDGPPSPRALTEVLGHEAVKGIRLSFHGSRNNSVRLQDGSLEWIWETLDDLGGAVMVNAPGGASVLADIARHYPGMRLIVDHLAIESGTHSDLLAQVAKLHEMVPLGNVAVKASALPTTVDELYPFPSLKEAMRDVIGAFGAGRVLWGSDLSRLPCTYRQMVDFFLLELDLSAEEREQLMGRSLARWLAWDVAPAQP